MGARARVAAAACLVTSGLLASGAGSATAFAEPSSDRDPASVRAESAAGADNDSARAERRPNRTTRQGASDDSDGPDDSGGDVSDLKDPDDPQDSDSPVKHPGVPGGSDRQPGGGQEWEWPGWHDDCGGWPWPWPRPEPDPAVGESGASHGGGLPEGGAPALRQFPGIGLPPAWMPAVEEPLVPDVVDAVADVGAPAVGAAGAPFSVPIVAPVPVGVPVSAGAPAAVGAGPAGVPSGFGGGGAGAPAAPRLAPAEPPPARGPLPATAGGNAGIPASSYRTGYGDYLRGAGLSQVAALAVPGLAGILVLTGAGGLVGYRQAKAGRAVRTGGTARFMN